MRSVPNQSGGAHHRRLPLRERGLDGSRLLVMSIVGKACDEHRAWSSAEDLCRDRAEDDTCQVSAFVSSHHNEACFDVYRKLDDLVGGIADPNEDLNPFAQGIRLVAELFRKQLLDALVRFADHG